MDSLVKLGEGRMSVDSVNNTGSTEFIGKPNPLKLGFTLVELLLVMGIMGVLFSIATIGFFGVQGKYSEAQGVQLLVADMRSQQTKAMTGVMNGANVPDGYGIHFGIDSYTLFAGTSYDSMSSSNAVVNLPAGITFSADGFANGNVVFLRASGEVSGYVQDADYVDLTSGSSNTTTRVKVNRLGVVVEGI